MLTQSEKYFIRFGQLDMPNVGQLKYIKKEATLLNGVLVPPISSIEFELGKGIPQKHFHLFLANELDISLDQAVLEFDNFWQSQFNNESPILLGNLGSIIKTEHSFQWVSHFDASCYYTPIEVDTIKNDDELSEVIFNKQKDYWIKWAILLGIIAFIAILLKQ